MGFTLTYITGGARSGKSSFAQRLAHERAGDSVLYVATLRETDAVREDGEMRARIARHRSNRPASWHTLVLGDDLNAIAEAAREQLARCVLLDCLSLYISGALFMDADLPAQPENAASAAAQRLLTVLRDTCADVIVVSNEVGMGVVPENAWARAYRDALGRANQLLAAAAEEAHLLVSGLPLKLK
jgi:adenosylcobinamide kinase / adenosylcobinamide-phosphate guanylyltransferase